MSQCDEILNELGIIVGATNSISARLGNIEARLTNIESSINVINNLIDSLENILVNKINAVEAVITTAINALRDILTSLINNLFGGFGNDTQKIINAISQAEQNINSTIYQNLLGVELELDLIRRSIDDCCNNILQTINNTTGEIKEKIGGLELKVLDAISEIITKLKEQIGGVEKVIVDEINQNEELIKELCKQEPDWITRILAAIAALGELIGKCDNQQIIDTINTCCNKLEGLILRIQFEPIINTINTCCDKLDKTLNTVEINILGTVNNNYQAIEKVNNIVNNNYQTIQKVDNIVNNNYQTIQKVNNTVSELITNTNNILNSVNILTSVVNNINNTTILQNTDIIINLVQSISQSTNNILRSINEVCADINADLQLSEVNIPIFHTCDEDIEFSLTTIKGLETLTMLLFTQIKNLTAFQKCNLTDVEAVALLPEWWQVRLEGGTPQAVIAWGEVDPGTGKCLHSKYSMSVPHFINQKPSFCPFPRYKKGNYELIAYFADNSKIIINGFNEAECVRVYTSFLPFIEPDWVQTLKYKIGRRVSYPFKEIWVCPRFMRFFSSGTRNLNPDWTVYF